ncbi:sensor histidine kinase [Reichenbachiella agariperforans]|uniref:sensor histidine kinase n=1 Tax=Reichenbachiella agariperforans TaxID=156994 RepID=UPI001C095183|nr:ATP-binding protein [Reichenbachiella agariperforans]
MSISLLVLFETMMHYRQQQHQKSLDIRTLSLGKELIPRLDRELNKVAYLSMGIEAYLKVYHQEINTEKLQGVLTETWKQSPFIRSLGLSRGTVIQYVAPIEGNEEAIGMDYRTNPEQWPDINQIIQTGEGLLLGPVSLVQGGESFIYRKPIYTNGELWGILSTVVEISPFFNAAFKEFTSKGYEVAIRRLHKDAYISLYGDPQLFEQNNALKLQTNFINQGWEYAISSPDDQEEFATFSFWLWLGRSLWIVLGVAIIYTLQVSTANRIHVRKHELLAKNISDVIWVYNVAQRRFTYVSPSIQTHAGYNTQETLGLTLGQTLTPESKQIIEKRLNESVARFTQTKNNQPLLLELQQKTKLGKVIWIEVSCNFSFNNQNEIMITGITRNIDDRKKTELELARNELKLAKLNATKDDFFSIIGHDLKSPFNSLTGTLDFLITNSATLSDADKLQCLTMCRESTSQATKLLENLLTWARSQTGDITFEQESIDLNHSILDSIKLLAVTANNKSIEVNYHPTELPPVLADQQMVDTILRNLISNALKFTPRGGETSVQCKLQDDFIHVSISDTGVGIDEKTIPDLFQVNKKVSTKGTENESGTGLGLVLCKAFVEKNGGHIYVNSTLNQGSNFTFTLPIYQG